MVQQTKTVDIRMNAYVHDTFFLLENMSINVVQPSRHITMSGKKGAK